MNKIHATIFLILMSIFLVTGSNGFTEGYYTPSGSYITPLEITPEEIEKEKQKFLADAKRQGEAGESGFAVMEFSDGEVIKVKYGPDNLPSEKTKKFMPLIIAGIALLGACFLFMK